LEEREMATTQGLFDADGHVYELDHELIEYLEPPFRGKKEPIKHFQERPDLSDDTKSESWARMRDSFTR
jgi:hypothetical protein